MSPILLIGVLLFVGLFGGEAAKWLRLPKVTGFILAGGLIPQGGVVVGLALLMRQDPALAGSANVVISVVIGATVVHGILGPILSLVAMRAAGEIAARQ